MYSCSWPAYQVNANYDLISKYCNLWRNFGDIDNNIETVAGIAYLYAVNQDHLSVVHGPNKYGKGWNDADQLIIGNPNITLNQAQSQMALWSILATPLIMSADLRKIREEFADILMNKNLIAIRSNGQTNSNN